MSDLLRTILIMSLSGSIVTVLLFVLKPFIRNRLPKLSQYYLWLVVIAALLVPVSKLVVFPETNRLSIPATPIINDTVTRYVVMAEEALERGREYRAEQWVETANNSQDSKPVNINLSLQKWQKNAARSVIPCKGQPEAEYIIS